MKIVGDMSEWSGMLKDLFRQIDDGSISQGELQAFLEHKNPCEILDPRKEWQKFYFDVFGIDVDFSDVQIPKKQEGFDRLIIMAKGITAQMAYDKCKENFSCWKWTDKDLVAQSDRTTNESYAVWVRNRVEADEELKNLSADDLKQKCISGVTLEERLVHELKYFKETGKHLDIEHWTLCSGSRYSDSGVPRVCWVRHGSGMAVSRCGPGFARSFLRSRRVVS